MSKKSLLVSLVLTIVLSISMFAGAGTPTSPPNPPQPPTKALEELGVEIEGFSTGPLIFGQKDETTRYAHTVFFDPATCNIATTKGFVGYQIVSFDTSVLQVKGFPETGQITLRRGDKPGVALYYFVLDKTRGDKKEGKLLGRLSGEQVTVMSTTEQSIFERMDTIVYPEQPFVRSGNQVELKILHFAGQTTLSPVALLLDVTTPDGRRVGSLQYFGTHSGFGNLTLEPNKAKSVSHFFSDIDGKSLPGRYKYVAILSDATKVLAFNRFEVVLGQYDFPGKPGSVSVDFADLNTDYDNKPALISLYGQMPDRINEKDVRIILNGDLISQYRMRSFVDHYSTFNLNVEVKGIEFPAAEYEVLVFFLSTGHVLKANLSVSVNPRDIIRNQIFGGRGLAMEMESVSNSIMAEDIKAKVDQMFSRLGIARRH